MAQTRLKSGNLHMVGGDNGSDGNVLYSKGDGTMEWGAIVVNPTFSSVDYPGSTTALDPAGGESLVINGTTFNVGITVTIGGTTPSSITRNSENQLTVTAPAKTAGTYNIVFTNTDGGTATAINAVSYNGVPAFTNAAGSLGSVKDGDAINFSVAATEPDGGAITYAVTSGSLPSGATLNTTTGAITGTAPSVNADTTSNFTITATDNENQTASRAYSITITPKLPSDSFQVVTYTGTGSTQSITGVGFQPDFVWCKTRSATGDHNLTDSTRGVSQGLNPNTTAVEGNQAPLGVTSFDTGGFTVSDNSGGGASVNGTGQDYVAWCLKANGGTTSSNTDGTVTSTVQANQDAGFSIVKYTGAGGVDTIGHGLSAAPEMIIVKSLGHSASWYTYHIGLDASSPEDYNVRLNQTDARQDSLTYWNDTAPTNSVFTLGTTTGVSQNGTDFIAYCFHSVDSFSKFGSYTGNGSTNGPIVETGFEPAFLMIKRTDTSGYNWNIWDNKRTPAGEKVLYADLTNAEGSYGYIKFLSNGFQNTRTNAGVNANGGTYIYMAFAADPDTTAPTLADSFNAVTYTGNGGTQSITGVGFKPNMTWIKHRNEANDHVLTDSIRGRGLIYPNGNDAQNQDSQLTSFDSDGFSLAYASGQNVKFNKSSGAYVAWNWKADDNEPTIFGGPARAVYKFEDNANDVTGTYNGTASNVTYSSSGKFNKAAEFNGSSSKITSTAGISGNPVFSISFWINPTSNNGTPIMFGNNAAGQALLTYVNSSNKINFGRWGDSLGDSTASVPNSTWTHVVISNNAGNVQLYINGTADLSFSTTYSIANTNFYIGAANTAQYFNGKIDQVRIYNGALEQIHVTELYNETTSDNDDLTLGAPPKSIVSANANAGFSIVKWEGTGTQTQIPHGLSAVPEMIISKRLDSANNWSVYHKDLSLSHSTYPNWLYLNVNSSEQNSVSSANHPYYARPSATVIYQNTGTSESTNVSGGDYISYCFHSVSNYSKFGSYTGTGGDMTVTTGFQPDFVMIKRTDSTGNWVIVDSLRNAGDTRLYADLSNAEDTGQGESFVSTGFKPRTSTTNDTNTSGGTYIYMAFKIN